MGRREGVPEETEPKLACLLLHKFESPMMSSHNLVLRSLKGRKWLGALAQSNMLAIMMYPTPCQLSNLLSIVVLPWMTPLGKFEARIHHKLHETLS